MTSRPVVGVVMGSDSDWPVMEAAVTALTEFGVGWGADVVSAHRMPREMISYGSEAAGRGLRAVEGRPGLPAILATLPEDVHPKQARVTDLEVAQLEKEMDAFNQELPALRSFVLAGSSRLNAELDICRTVCRRAERACVTLARLESVPPEALRYLNRLSDALFVLSRWVTHISGTPETIWEPNQAASGKSE